MLEAIRNHPRGIRAGFLLYQHELHVSDLADFDSEELQHLLFATQRDDLRTEATRLMSENSF